MDQKSHCVRVILGRGEVQRSPGVIISFVQIDASVEKGNQSPDIAILGREQNLPNSSLLGMIFVLRRIQFFDAYTA